MKKILLFLVLPIIVTAAEVPLFTVPNVKNEVKIDGILSTEEWNSAVKISNFMRMGDNRFASEQTQVMVQYSQKYLYFAFKLNEYALDKYSNQYKSFIAKLKGKNKPVWEDDSIEMRLAPPWIKDLQFFYIGLGAGGATKVKEPKNFNGNLENNLKYAVKEYNGYWCAELALPLTSLGSKGIGDWKVNFVRFEKRIPENSSYCPLFAGEHGNLGKYATMRFATDNTPVVREGDYSKLSSLTFLPFSLRGRKWQGTWTSLSGNKIKTGKVSSPGKFTIETAPLETAYGNVTIKVGDFYVSPNYPQTKASSKIVVSGNFAWQGLFNKKIISPKDSTLYPIEGLNKLEFSINPKKYIQLNTTTELGLPVKWIVPVGGRVETINKGVKLLNLSNEKLTFSAEFLHKGSKFIPPGVERQTLHLTEDGTYIFNWDILNTKGWNFKKSLEKAEFHLYLPDSVEFLGVDNRVKYPNGFKKLNWPADKQFYTYINLGKKIVLGKKLNHWVIKRSEPVKYCYEKSLLHHQVKREKAAIFLRGKKNYDKSNSTAFYHMAAFDGKLGETVQMIPVMIHPKLNGSYVPDLTASLMNYWCDDLENSNLTKPFYDTLLAAGVNEVVMDSRFAPPRKIKYLARMEIERINWRNTYPDLEAFFKKHPDSCVVNYKGHKEPVISISHLLEHKELHHEFFDSLVQLKKDYPGIGGLFIDLEEDPFRSRYGGDYSVASLKRFAEKYKITEKLTPQIIKSKYSEKWISFRGSEIGSYCKMLRPMCKKLGWDLTFYTDYDSPKAVRMYTADWQYLEGAIDRAYMGYGRDPRTIESTRKKLPATPLVFGLLTWTNTANYEISIHLRRIIDSKQGVLMWFARGFGAKEAIALANTTRCYDKFRGFFNSGKRVDEKYNIPDLAKDEVIALKLGSKTMLLLLNNSYQPKKLSLNLLDKDSKYLTEFFSGKSFAKGSKIEITIPPREAAVFCGNLHYFAANQKSSEKNYILNGSFEKQEKDEKTILNWRGRKDCFLPIRSAQRAISGKHSAMFESNGSKNVLMIQHINPKSVANFSKIQISMQIFVDSLQAGFIMPLQLIVVTNENGKRKSNYPGARIFSKTGDGMASWIRIQKEYDLRKYKNIQSVELWITGWEYKKTPFKGKFFIDDVKVTGIQ